MKASTVKLAKNLQRGDVLSLPSGALETVASVSVVKDACCVITESKMVLDFAATIFLPVFPTGYSHPTPHAGNEGLHGQIVEACDAARETREAAAEVWAERLEEKAALRAREEAEHVSAYEAKMRRDDELMEMPNVVMLPAGAEDTIEADALAAAAQLMGEAVLPSRPVTGPQTKFITNLVDQILRAGGEVILDADGIVAEANKDADPVKKASFFIDKLKERLDEAKKNAPKVAPKIAPKLETDVPAGRYAVEVDGELGFYRVNKPEGRWAGYTFVDAVAGAPGGFQYHKISNKDRIAAILGQIEKDGPREAMIRFGHEVGACGRCGAGLTDEISRTMGIGPICAGKI